MNENTLFTQALKDVIDEDYNADMEAISLNDEHEFSDKHNSFYNWFKSFLCINKFEFSFINFIKYDNTGNAYF